ncbi:MAG: hypothetical protein BroJett040_14970 [Oligoflexia bacterium]|nr:MAG: hypothetical protein BroJett040_14970 [Oligoflexia bacterium]
MKKFFSNRIVISAISFLVGGFFVCSYQQYQSRNILHHKEFRFSGTKTELKDLFDNEFNNDFFGRSNSPFEEMNRLQQEMRENFQSSSSNEMYQREDDNYVYYELDLKNQTPKDFNVEVRDGQITISGRLESEQRDDRFSQHYSSSFHRSFPAPSNVDAEKYSIDHNDHKIVIRFPKRKEV